MEIIKIVHHKKTTEEDYTLITFKTWWGKEFTEVCTTPNWNVNTTYAKNGNHIPILLWAIVKAFIRTGDKTHEY